MSREHWVDTTIGDIADIIGGGTPDASDQSNFTNDSGIPWLTPKDLSGYTGKYISCGERFLTEKGYKESSAKLLPKGTVIFSSRAPIGYIAIAANDICTNQGFKSFICNESIFNEFVYYWLISKNQELQEMGSGTTFKEISGKIARTIPIVIPPLPEQLRIVAKLDAILPKVKSAKARLEKIPGLLKKFRQSVLAAACSGRLTEDWREGKGLPEWGDVLLKEIADIKGGITKDSSKQKAQDVELPYLRVANVQRGYLDLTEVKTIRIPKEKVNDYLLKAGDILLNEGGDPDKLGRGWIWEEQIKICTHQNHVFRARLFNNNNESKYVSWFSNTIGFDFFLNSGKQTTGLASINKTMVSNLRIQLPPAEEQSEIVRRVEKLFSLADSLEAKYKAAMARVEKIEQAVLAKAFRGELVEPDPPDEPGRGVAEEDHGGEGEIGGREEGQES